MNKGMSSEALSVRLRERNTVPSALGSGEELGENLGQGMIMNRTVIGVAEVWRRYKFIVVGRVLVVSLRQFSFCNLQLLHCALLS